MFDARLSVGMPDARTTSVIFASPHSGRDYPASFLQDAILMPMRSGRPRMPLLICFTRMRRNMAPLC